ncbi:MAG: TIGR02466 family protein [Kiloniellales bacterium]
MTFRDVQAIPFFATMVWSYDLAPELAEPMNRRLLAKLDALLTPRPPLQPGQTWQTDQRLHRLSEFAELVGYINEAASRVMEILQVEHEGFEITGCWANINPPGEPHTPHNHPNNYLSGVYYVKTAPGGDSLSFYDPRPETNVIAPRVKQPNPYNLRRLELRTPPGRLVLFPAWFRHGVGRNMSSEERVSIAFNIMFSAFTECLSAPKWEGIATGGGNL